MSSTPSAQPHASYTKLKTQDLDSASRALGHVPNNHIISQALINLDDYHPQPKFPFFWVLWSLRVGLRATMVMEWRKPGLVNPVHGGHEQLAAAEGHAIERLNCKHPELYTLNPKALSILNPKP